MAGSPRGHLQALRLRQAVNLDALPDVGQRLLGQVNARHPRAGPQPLDEIGARAKAHLQHALAAIARELGKRMDERLVPVAPLFDLLEVFAAELLRLRLPGVAALPVPEGLYLVLERGRFAGRRGRNRLMPYGTGLNLLRLWLDIRLRHRVNLRPARRYQTRPGTLAARFATGQQPCSADL